MDTSSALVSASSGSSDLGPSVRLGSGRAGALASRSRYHGFRRSFLACQFACFLCSRLGGLHADAVRRQPCLCEEILIAVAVEHESRVVLYLADDAICLNQRAIVSILAAQLQNLRRRIGIRTPHAIFSPPERVVAPTHLLP